MRENPVVWLEDVSKGDISLVGGKGANLGEITKLGIPVPPAFIVTSHSYLHFLERPGLIQKIRRTLETLDINQNTQLQEASSQIKESIISAPMPSSIDEAIRKAYHRLGRGLVAVRSSATAEDLPEASFAGQQRTFLNIEGEDRVVAAVQECWASLFEPRAIFYRVQHGFDDLKVGIAVPVQRMVQAEISGVLFTAEPVSGNREQICIEAIYGLGEAVVSGEVTPDRYIVDKRELTILHKMVVKQEQKLVKNPQADGSTRECNVWVALSSREQKKQTLPDEEIIALARIGKKIERHYGSPQDIEWARENDKFYIVQTRPITTLKEAVDVEEEEVKAPLLLSGSAATPGVGSGPVTIVRNISEMDRIKEGNVLVAEMTSPDFVPAMKRAAAIVTDKGGVTSHAAIVSRELGKPCVVGTEVATQTLEDGQLVTVVVKLDGSPGRVYEGRVAVDKEEAEFLGEDVRTLTKVLVNLADPDLAEEMASRDVDGVGLLRAEFIVAHIGEHPRYMLDHGRGAEFVEKLTEGITKFARAFHPRPVVYRTNDFKTNEYRNLKGGEAYEEVEENPMLGYRGCSRYINDRDVFKLEIETIKRVRERYKNLWVMLPFVRTVGELAQAKEILQEEGLRSSQDFKLWMMVEVPSNVILLDDFIDVGLDGISIGSNDLTQLTLGVDRDNSRLAELFDERNDAVLWSLERVISIAKRRGITYSICGQAPSFYPELTAKLVEWGVTSVSVSPDMINRTRQIMAEVERRLGKVPI
ncbi:MAG: phosphoenolpyruvate synthase [Dehalococcoidia bacterium]